MASACGLPSGVRVRRPTLTAGLCVRSRSGRLLRLRGLALGALVPVAPQAEPRLREHVGRVVDRRRRGRPARAARRTNSSWLMPSRTQPAQRSSSSCRRARWSGDVALDAEVDQREALRLAARDLVDRGVPGLDVDVGRRRGREDVALAAAGGSRTRRRRAAGRRGSSRRGARRGPASGTPPSRRRRRRRSGCSPPASGTSSFQKRSKSSPNSRRAEASSRDGSTRCGAPISDTQTVSSGMAPHDRPGRARVVEVDVREQQVPDVGELEVELARGTPRAAAASSPARSRGARARRRSRRRRRRSPARGRGSAGRAGRASRRA